MNTERTKQIQEFLKTSTLEREKFLFHDLGEILAERLFLYFHGTVDFDCDEKGDGAFVECNLPHLFAILCLCIENATSSLGSIRMCAKEDLAQFSLVFTEKVSLPEREIYENACLCGIGLEFLENEISL